MYFIMLNWNEKNLIKYSVCKWGSGEMHSWKVQYFYRKNLFQQKRGKISLVRALSREMEEFGSNPWWEGKPEGFRSRPSHPNWHSKTTLLSVLLPFLLILCSSPMNSGKSWPKFKFLSISWTLQPPEYETVSSSLRTNKSRIIKQDHPFPLNVNHSQKLYCLPPLLMPIYWVPSISLDIVLNKYSDIRAGKPEMAYLETKPQHLFDF